MATAKEKAAPRAADRNNELVEYTAPLLGSPNKKDILVSVNGETVRIKRGVPVKIKRKFLNVLHQSAEQEMAAYLAMQRAQAQSRKAMANL